MYCPFCGNDITDMLEERGKFPITSLWEVVCNWCRENVVCYPVKEGE